MKRFYTNTIPIFILLFSVFFSLSVNAQNDNEVDYQTVNITNRAGTSIYTEDVKEVKGSPVIKESFEEGRILFKSGKASEVVPINYNSYKNQVLFIKNDQIMVLNTNGVKGFLFNKPTDFESSDKVQEIYSFQIDGEALGFDEPTPVQVFYNQGSGLKLFAVHKTNLLRSNRKDPFTGKKIDRYVNSTEYYLQNHDGDIEKIKRLRAKDIINKFDSEHQKMMKKFMKENDLDSKSEKDLVKLLTFIDNEISRNS